MSDMIEICSSVEQLAFSGTLDLHRLCYPKSHGLESLNAQLYGDTHISTEGLVDRIKTKLRKVKRRIGEALDKLAIALNTLIEKLGLLSRLQKKELQEVKEGKRRLRSTSLPISRKTLVTIVKVVGLMMAGVFSAIAAAKVKDVADRMHHSQDLDRRFRVHGERVNHNQKLHDRIMLANEAIKHYQRKLKQGKKEGASAEEIDRVIRTIEKNRDHILKWKSQLYTDSETVKIVKNLKRKERIADGVEMSQVIFMFTGVVALTTAANMVRTGIAKLISPILGGIRTLQRRSH